MRLVPSDDQVVLTRCIDLIGTDDEIDAEPEIDPMLGQPGPSAGK